jgi:hypothetical protein
VVVEKGKNRKFQPYFYIRAKAPFLMEHNKAVKLILLLAASVLLLVVSCEDPLDSVVTKKDSNDLFELTLETSNNIVNSQHSLDIIAKVERLTDGIADLSNKILGVWDLIYDEPDTLDPTLLEIHYTFNNDNTVTRVETHRFADIFSKIVGKWNIHSIGTDTINSELLAIEYDFDDDTTMTVEETHIFDVSKLGSKVLGVWKVTEASDAPDLSNLTLEYTFENDSSVTFSRTQITSEGIDVGYASVPAFVDIDRDADKDVFIGSQEGTIVYYENTGSSVKAVFTQKTGSDNPLNGVVVSGTASPSFVDIDADGDMDLFIGKDDGTISHYANGGSSTSPSFSEKTGNDNPLNGADVGYNSKPIFADIDGDGDMDAFMGEYDGTINYYQNTGSSTTATFTVQADADALFDSDVGTNSAPTFVDIDKDGDLDVFIGAGNGIIQYYKNIGSNAAHSFSPQVGNDNPLNAVDVGEGDNANATPAFVDIDGDGDMDLFVGEYLGTNYFYLNSGSIIEASFGSPTVLGASKSTVRAGGWTYTDVTKQVQVAFYDTSGGEIETGTVSFDTDSLTIPVSAYMYWKTDKRDVTFQKTAHVTGFSAPADSVVSLSGGWGYDKETNLLSVIVFGQTESGVVSFDTKSSTVPVGAFMYWESSDRGSITFVKTANVSGADATPDSVVTSAGGWNWDTAAGVLSATIMGSQLSGSVTFETEGQTVPINGFMYWQTDQEGNLTFKKISNVSGSSISSMKLALDATSGSLDIHHVSSTSNITVVIADTAKSKFQVEGLFVPSSTKTSALVSAQFQDLFVKIPITIVKR